MSGRLCTILATALLAASAAAQLPLPRLATGELYVSDFGNDRICVYDAAGSYLRSFSAAGLNGPRGIAFTAGGQIWVSSELSDSVFVFAANESFVTQLTTPDLDGPTGIAESPSGEMLVSSFNRGRICVFSSNGTFLRTIGTGVLGLPNCAAFDSRGHLWVADVSGARIVEFDANEQLVAAHTPTPGTFSLSSPMAIARDHCDNLWVSGGGSGNLLKLTTTGAFVAEIRHADLTGPQGITFDERGHMFSSSYYLDRLVEFDADGNWVRTITAGGLNVPRSLAFAPVAVPTATVYGCGVNPPNSITAPAAPPRIGQTVSVGLDNPAGTQTPGATTPWLLGSLRRYAPCGVAVPGFGMASPGAAGEFLIDLGIPHFVLGSGPAWTTPGQPSTVSFLLPDDCGIVGWRFYVQGVLLDFGPGSPVPIGLTDALELLIDD